MLRATPYFGQIDGCKSTHYHLVTSSILWEEITATRANESLVSLLGVVLGGGDSDLGHGCNVMVLSNRFAYGLAELIEMSGASLAHELTDPVFAELERPEGLSL